MWNPFGGASGGEKTRRYKEAISLPRHNEIGQEIKRELKMERYDVYDGLAPLKYRPKLEKILGKNKIGQYFN